MLKNNQVNYKKQKAEKGGDLFHPTEENFINTL